MIAESYDLIVGKKIEYGSQRKLCVHKYFTNLLALTLDEC